MAAALPPALDCCCDDNSPSTVEVPGPSGPAGADGEDGEDGANAFTETTSAFTVPAVDEEVAILVDDNTFVNVGQIIHIENAGYYSVTGKSGTTDLVVQNLGTTGNTSEGGEIPVGSQVTPGGSPGVQGAKGDAGVTDLKVVTNRTELKALSSDTDRKLVFLLAPEPGVARAYRSIYGSDATADDESVIASDDGLTRYFEYHLS